MKLNLEDKNWKEFKISNIFDVYTGAQIPKRKLKEGNIPRITATDTTNGVFEFYSKPEHKNYRELENFISVSFLGSVFYHSYKASLDMKIHAVKVKNFELNKYIAEFLIIAIKRTVSRASYGNQMSSTDLPDKRVFLPINSQGNPDYEFMEAYMRQKEQKKLDKYKQFVSKRLPQLQDYEEVEPLEDKRWKEFIIENLFSIKIGKNVDGNKINKNGGKTAYITRKELNNGLDGFIQYDDKYLNSQYPVITIGNETAKPFVQQYPFFTGTKVNILRHKKLISIEIYKFIAQCLEMHRDKYSYSFTINSTRLKRQKIMLPINQDNKPDYEYMENYIKKIEYKKLSSYLSYKQI